MALGGPVADAAIVDLPLPDLASRDLAARLDLADVPCNPVTQAPCPPDQKCELVDTSNNTFCRPLVGSRMIGQDCNGLPNLDTCARGLQCLFPGGGTACEQWCVTETDCTQRAVPVGDMLEPGNTAHCFFPLAPDAGISLCSIACNPVATAGPSGCPTGGTCVWSNGSSRGEFTFCDTPSSATDGQACVNFGCAAGLTCTGTTAPEGTHCRPVCRNGINSDCPNSYVCNTFGLPTMFGICCPATGC
jgi:hypothetical protein